MASWMIHLRVAQQLYRQLNIESINEFVLGNIAPDSGIPSKDGSGFIPDAAVSHFRSLDENGIKNIHEEQFIRRYFTPAHRLSYSKKEDAFFLGYLTHLLTDKIWAREIVYSAKEKQNKLFHTNRELFWQTIPCLRLSVFIVRARTSEIHMSIFSQKMLLKNVECLF